MRCPARGTAPGGSSQRGRSFTAGSRGTSPACATDATNASRTLLMDLRTLEWDDGLLDAIGVPRALLAGIGPSSGVVGEIGGMPPGSAAPGD